MAVTIRELGNLLQINIDGILLTAYPTPGGTWFARLPGGGPDPGDPDPSGDGFAWPFPLSEVSSEYGPRSGRVHQGIDFSGSTAHNGAEIHASQAGTVYNNPHAYHSGFGWHVVLDHGTINGVRLFTLYAHMQEASPRPIQGASVDKWDVIGWVGNTGNSFGAHLHFETHITGGGGPTWTNPGTHRNPREFMGVYGE